MNVMLYKAAILVLFLPLIASLIYPLLCKKRQLLSKFSSIMMLMTMIMSYWIFCHMCLYNDIIHITLFKWLSIESVTINWTAYIDQLTSLMFIVVNTVSFVVHVYSLGYMKDDKNLAKFLSFLSLFTFFMLALVSADNFVQLFFGWEGVGLCSYLLIGYWYTKDNANVAAIKAFIVNRVADAAFIIGIITLFVYSGDINFNKVFSQAQYLSSIEVYFFSYTFSILDIICFLLFIGCMGKSAQIGLHIWLPDAMEGPTPVSALIHAATMVTAGVFLLARCSYLFEYAPIVLQFIAIVGAVTCIFAALVAITQNDIKKIIAYSTCSQLGYMFLSCGVSAYSAAMFHLTTHAFFKALLFLSAGSVIHACSHNQDILKMGGLKNRMLITYVNFWIASLAIIGIFPLAGYYSKDIVLESVYLSTNHVLFVIGIITALLTAIYSMKILLLVFHGKTRMTMDEFNKVHEASFIMNIPLFILIIGSIFAGIIGFNVLKIVDSPGYFLDSIFHDKHLGTEHVSNFIQKLPMITGLVGIIFGFYLYRGNLFKFIANKFKIVHVVLKNKFYFDELYHYMIIRLMNGISMVCYVFDKKILDRYGPGGFAKIANILSWCISRLHTGYIFHYSFLLVLVITAYITYFITLL